MPTSSSPTAAGAAEAGSLEVRLTSGDDLEDRIGELDWQPLCGENPHSDRDPRWLLVLRDGLKQEPFLLEAIRQGQTVGYLPLALVSSWLFGRFLVSLPYLSTVGVITEEPEVAERLVDEAIELAGQTRSRFLELRQERAWDHPELPEEMSAKVHMRLTLPEGGSEALWDSLKSKVRSQVKKGLQNEFSVAFGGQELLEDFYGIFARNMRDLGTPVYGQSLFRSMLRHFVDQAELCVLRDGSTPIAGAVLIHGPYTSVVPSASSIRDYNSKNCNMVLYWHMMARVADRGGRIFDFGRSTAEGPTHKFKKQWGAVESPSIWQYHRLQGEINTVRPENQKYGRLIRLWQRLPVWLTRVIGPPIVRGIP